MPEGPEVKSMINQLDNIIRNQSLLHIEIHSGRYSKKAPDNFSEFWDRFKYF